jgi:glycosyltransferase involved in cell wall biosynthesis
MKLRRNRSRESGLESLVEQLAQRVSDIELHAAEAIAARAAQQGALEGLEARINKLELAEQVRSVMGYVRAATVEKKALVSVILPTRNRSHHLPRAIGSVLEQTYPTWELLAVDDGSDDDTYDLLGAVGDERVRRLRIEHAGVCAARNRALAEVSGDYVAYLDDDNTMHADWLRSIVWAFTKWPEAELLYGATIIEGADSESVGRHGMPWLRFVPYDRAELERSNPTDLGAVAHRAGLPEAVFDQELASVEDWDLLLRFARTRDVLALPVVAGTYSTMGRDRLSGSATRERALRRLQCKHPNLISATQGPTA